MESKLLQSNHIPDILEFEKTAQLEPRGSVQFEMYSWDQPWRKESLSHYAQLGWSFIAVEDQEICGYVLAQPFLFFNNWTQVLWVEHLSSSAIETSYELMDVVIRWAKTKHLQKVLLNGQKNWNQEVLDRFQKFNKGEFFHLSTTKLNEGEA